MKPTAKKIQLTYKRAGKNYNVSISHLADSRLRQIATYRKIKDEDTPTYNITATVIEAVVAFSRIAGGPKEFDAIEMTARKSWGMNRSVLVEVSIHTLYHKLRSARGGLS